jgi:hypothetical protein
LGFSDWSAADHIVIKRLSNTTLKIITDRTVIARVAAFAEAHKNGWGVPWVGTPVSAVTLEFYSRAQFLGHLGIGRSFLEAQGCDGFASRNLTAEDRGDISRLIGVSEDLL